MTDTVPAAVDKLKSQLRKYGGVPDLIEECGDDPRKLERYLDEARFVLDTWKRRGRLPRWVAEEGTPEMKRDKTRSRQSQAASADRKKAAMAAAVESRLGGRASAWFEEDADPGTPGNATVTARRAPRTTKSERRRRNRLLRGAVAESNASSTARSGRNATATVEAAVPRESRKARHQVGSGPPAGSAAVDASKEVGSDAGAGGNGGGRRGKATSKRTRSSDGGSAEGVGVEGGRVTGGKRRRTGTGADEDSDGASTRDATSTSTGRQAPDAGPGKANSGSAGGRGAGDADSKTRGTALRGGARGGARGGGRSAKAHAVAALAAVRGGGGGGGGSGHEGWGGCWGQVGAGMDKMSTAEEGSGRDVMQTSVAPQEVGLPVGSLHVCLCLSVSVYLSLSLSLPRHRQASISLLACMSAVAYTATPTPTRLKQ